MFIVKKSFLLMLSSSPDLGRDDPHLRVAVSRLRIPAFILHPSSFILYLTHSSAISVSTLTGTVRKYS